MILKIGVKGSKEKVDYVSCKQANGAAGGTLRIKGNSAGIAISVMLQNDIGQIPKDEDFGAFPNSDGTPWVIMSDGFYALRVLNNYVQLQVPDGSNLDGIEAIYS
jgi:hypothetical protein